MCMISMDEEADKALLTLVPVFWQQAFFLAFSLVETIFLTLKNEVRGGTIAQG